MICTLPISPRINNKLMMLFTPFVTSLLAKWKQVNFSVMLNLTGFKAYENDNMDKITAAYSKDLSFLNQGSDFSIKNDKDSDYQIFFKNIFSFLKEKKVIFERKEKMFWCDCGCIEISEVALTTLMNQKNNKARLFFCYSGSKLPVCKICHSNFRSGEESVLVLNLPIVCPDNVYPCGMFGQFKQSFGQLTNDTRIISRGHRKGNKTLFADGWSLDPDFWWLPYLPWINKDKNDVTLVSGLNTITKAIRSLSIAKLINPKLKTELFIHPLIRLMDHKSRLSTITTSEFIKAYPNSNVLRSFLSLGLSWTADRVILNSNELHLVIKTITDDVIKKFGMLQLAPMPTQFFAKLLNRDNLLKIFKKIRGKKELTDEEKRSIDIIVC